jgi:hypothetical protein
MGRRTCANNMDKSIFIEFPKCDMLLNNYSEVFNSYIFEAREMFFLSILETIFYKILQRIETKQREAKKWTGRIYPKKRRRWTSSWNGASSVMSLQLEITYTL